MERPALALFDAEHRIAAASPECSALLSQTSDHLVGSRCRDAFGCPTCVGQACPLEQAFSGHPAEGLLPAQRNGHPLSISASPMTSAGGPRVVLVNLREASSPEAVLGAGLQPALDSLRSLLRSDLAALAIYDSRLKEVRWQVTSGSVSTRTAEIRLRPGQGFAGRILMTDLPLRTFRFPEDLTSDPDSYPIFLAEGLRSAIGVPLGSKEKVTGVLMVASRVEREYTQRDLAQLRKVARSMGLAAEMMRLHEEAIRAERVRLAQEVHDGLSQNLFGLRLLVHDLHEQMKANEPEQVEQGLRRTFGVLESTLGEVRRLITDLRASTRVQTGLIRALSDQLGHFYRTTGMTVEFAVRLAPGEEIERSDAQEILRIVQEALMNVYRHASATRVRVEARRENGAYQIAIEDDGRGFDPAVGASEGHYGLAIMQERAERLKANLEVTSAPGQGTVVVLSLPV